MYQKKIGVILSYINLIISMIINIFLTPYLISCLGDVDYSIYKVMQSFAGPLAIFHLGISTIVTRSVVKCNASEDYSENDKKNTMALALLASFAMSLIVAIVGFIMYSLIPKMYGKTYDQSTLLLGKRIFLVFVFSSIIHMMGDAFSGTLLGHEKYVVSSSIPLAKNILKTILIILFLKLNFGVFFIVLVDLIISIVSLLFVIVYSICLGEIPRLTKFDKKQIIEIFMFGSAIFLQAIVNQVNNNVDIMLLGAYVNEKSIITMYSSALVIYSFYNSFISAITNLFLPSATELIINNPSGEELTNFVIKPGRYQAIIAVGCICGFALFGNNFITIWIGERYKDAYWVILMLMIPVSIPLVENAAISILDASLKRIYRSVVLVIMAVLNVIVSIVFISYIGFWGAALGTVLSLIIGHGFLMNIYYRKEFNMQIGRMFASIFRGILPAGILASILCIPVSVCLQDNIIFFLVKCSCFIVLYFVFLMIFGITKEEKNNLLGIIFRKSNH